MRRFISVAPVLIGLLLATTFVGPGAVAQDESTSTAGHPMVGTWLIEPSTGEPPELFFAGADGVAASTSVEGTGFGSWTATGERTADATIRFPMVDPEAGFLGMATMRASVEVAADGQSFAGTFTAELPAAMAEAMGLPVGELGPGDVSGVRVVVEPMGEPVAPMPEMAEEAPAE
jgi:hypothetical protein